MRVRLIELAIEIHIDILTSDHIETLRQSLTTSSNQWLATATHTFKRQRQSQSQTHAQNPPNNDSNAVEAMVKDTKLYHLQREIGNCSNINTMPRLYLSLSVSHSRCNGEKRTTALPSK